MDKLKHCKAMLIAWRKLHSCGYDTPEAYDRMLNERADTIRMVGMFRYVAFMLGVTQDVSPSIVCLIDQHGNEIHPGANGTTLGEYLVAHFDENSLPVLVRYRTVELAL